MGKEVVCMTKLCLRIVSYPVSFFQSICRNLVPEILNSSVDSDSIPHFCYTQLLENGLVDVKEGVTRDVVFYRAEVSQHILTKTRTPLLFAWLV